MAEGGPNKVTCKKCGRATFPTRAGNCFYCGKALEDLAATHAEPRALGREQPRFTAQADDRRHYLVLETGGQAEMTPGQLFVIGRDPHASLVVNSPDVSRQHCEVDWEGDAKRPVVAEVRSRNGTYLNERLVARGQKEPLRSGDTLRLGPGSVLRYFYMTPTEFARLQKETGAAQTAEFRAFSPSDADRAAAADGARARDASSGRIVGLPTAGAAAAPMPGESGAPAAPGGPAVQLSGRLKDVSAPALLKHLNEQRATGVLTFFDGKERGEAHLEEGRCVHATYGHKTGREVIAAFVKLTEGGYRFRRASDERREREPLPIPLRGRLSERPANELVALMEQHGVSGELTITDGPEVSGVAIFVDGVWTDAKFGDICGKMAKHMIAGLRHGEFKFREAGDVARRSGSASAIDREHEDIVAALADPVVDTPESIAAASAGPPGYAPGYAPAHDPPSSRARDPLTPGRARAAQTPARASGTSRAPVPPPPSMAPPTAPLPGGDRPGTGRAGAGPSQPLRAPRPAPPPLRSPSASGRQPVTGASSSDQRPPLPPLPVGPRSSASDPPTIREPSPHELRGADDGKPSSSSPFKESPLRDERPPPAAQTRPPLRGSGTGRGASGPLAVPGTESGRHRRAAPPPLPPRRGPDDADDGFDDFDDEL